jgi:hypothetical protein
VETLTAAAIEARQRQHLEPDTVVFRVGALYGVCPNGVDIPLGGDASVNSGPVTVTIDPEADGSCNLGVVDFAAHSLTVRYGVQAVFPALYDLMRDGDHDPALLNPVRMVATDDCTLTPNLMGWRALGCLEFLPGSVWSGAKGG